MSRQDYGRRIRRVCERTNDNFKGVATETDQGFLEKLVTSFLVICAVSGQARWNTIRTILLAWDLTLPFAAASAAVLYIVFSGIGVS